jgi:release factor glutamine methyltransferase
LRVKEILLSEKDLPRIDLLAIVSFALRLAPEWILSEPERAVDKAEADRIEQLIGERRRGKPLAYLTNRREFFSETFYVDERVLIPRPETELLVEEAIKSIGRKGRLRALDMGTGSGAIGILLAKRGAGYVLCVDISPDALDVAYRNSRLMGVQDRIDFVASDLFSALKDGETFDLVCANLPYVASSEWEGLMDDVREFEPRQALVGGETGTETYERCLQEMAGHLAEGGSALLEIGGERQAARLGALMREAGFEVAVLRDLAGRVRLLRGSWTSSS